MVIATFCRTRILLLYEGGEGEGKERGRLLYIFKLQCLYRGRTAGRKVDCRFYLNPNGYNSSWFFIMTKDHVKLGKTREV